MSLFDLQREVAPRRRSVRTESVKQLRLAPRYATRYSGQLEFEHKDLVKDLKEDITSFLKKCAITTQATNTSKTPKSKKKLQTLLDKKYHNENIMRYGVIAELEASVGWVERSETHQSTSPVSLASMSVHEPTQSSG